MPVQHAVSAHRIIEALGLTTHVAYAALSPDFRLSDPAGHTALFRPTIDFNSRPSLFAAFPECEGYQPQLKDLLSGQARLVTLSGAAHPGERPLTLSIVPADPENPDKGLLLVVSEIPNGSGGLRKAVAALPDALLAINPKEVITEMVIPEGLQDVISPAQVQPPAPLTEALPADMVTWLRPHLETARKQAAPLTVEHIRPTEGQTAYLRCTLTPTDDLVVLVIQDVSELKRAEQTIHSYADELQKRNAELDAYSRTVAHDLKGPLNSISGYADILDHVAGDQLKPGSKKYIERIQTLALGMASMIDSMLLLARVRDVEEIVHEVDMNSVITAVMERLQEQIEERSITVEVQPNMPTCTGHAPWLEEVFVNLVGNAIKYIGQNNETPTVKITAVVHEDGIHYAVTDNGIGISKQDQKQLFDSFTRFHREEADGFGLGLSIVDRIVRKLNGEVWVESTLGEGSTFWVELPPARS